MSTTLIKNGHLVDPANNRDGVFDIFIKNGKIDKVKNAIDIKADKIIDAKGKIVVPGLIDMHVHLREPGREDNETILSGTVSAVKSGITTVCTMPNTYPAIDDENEIRRLKEKIKKDASANVFIVGAITKERKGKEIADMAKMKKEGAIALSDDGSSVNDSSVMLEALKKAKTNDMLIISHAEDKSISKNGVVNEGIIATKLGLRAMPREAEYKFVKRDIELAKKAKTKIHIAHVSCKESLEIIKKAKKEGVKVTCETAPHYFSLTDAVCVDYDTRTKMNPPLRSKEDVEAIKQGIKEGIIDAIASDHAPHGKHEKEIEFDNAAFGIIGLETSLALSIKNLLKEKIISWGKLIELMSVNPARILGLKSKGSLKEGNDADITIIDPEKEWVYTKNAILSKSKNSPFINWRFKGKAIRALVLGAEK